MAQAHSSVPNRETSFHHKQLPARTQPYYFPTQLPLRRISPSCRNLDAGCAQSVTRSKLLMRWANHILAMLCPDTTMSSRTVSQNSRLSYDSLRHIRTKGRLSRGPKRDHCHIGRWLSPRICPVR